VTILGLFFSRETERPDLSAQLLARAGEGVALSQGSEPDAKPAGLPSQLFDLASDSDDERYVAESVG
jgi:hypothetical protein